MKSIVCTHKYLSVAFPTQNGPKQKDAWSSPLYLTLLYSNLFYFRICHQKGPQTSGRNRTEWNPLSPGLYWWC